MSRELDPGKLELVLVEVVELGGVDRGGASTIGVERVVRGARIWARISLHGDVDDRGDRGELAQLVPARALGRSAGQSSKLVPSVFVTSTCPELSTIVPARRLDLKRAHAVVARRDPVLRPGEHLERPEAQEQHREHGQRDEPEHRHAQRELRGQPVGLLDPRVGGQEAARAPSAQPRRRTSWTRSESCAGREEPAHEPVDAARSGPG